MVLCLVEKCGDGFIENIIGRKKQKMVLPGSYPLEELLRVQVMDILTGELPPTHTGSFLLPHKHLPGDHLRGGNLT